MASGAGLDPDSEGGLDREEQIMTDTKRYIKELKRALPGIKEKIVAVAFMLLLSLVMMVATSYAWYTLSFAPEVNNITTTVSSNGNLEIALSDLDGLAPDSSAVGDSSSKQGIMAANLTWGNLINLSGNYGIENLILRPATFTTSSKYFLSSVSYTEGGRVEGETTNFAFTTWKVTDALMGYHDFVVPSGPAFGVRAISSVGYSGAGQEILQAKLDAAKDRCKVATDGYDSTMKNSTYINTIRDIVQIYLNYNMYDTVANHPDYGGFVGLTGLSKDSSLTKNQVVELNNFYRSLYYDAVYPFGDALVYLANVHQSLKNAEYTEYTRETLMAATAEELKARGVELGDVLVKYKDLDGRCQEDLITMADFATRANNGEKIELRTETKLMEIVNHLLDINSVMINNGKEEKSVQAIMTGGLTNAKNFLDNVKDGATLQITAINGDIKLFEDLTGGRIDVNLYPINIKLSVLIITTGGNNLTGHLTTNSRDNKFQGLLINTMEMDSSTANNMVAQDTYGMVLDLWVRTNADNSVLTLDGLVASETIYEQRMIVLSGEAVSRPVYSYFRITGEELNGIEATEEVLVYKGDDGYYYRVSDRALVKLAVMQDYEYEDENGEIISGTALVETDPITDKDVTPKTDPKTIVKGFSGSNRVYDDLYVESGETSATQGSGSCFVFYADTSDQENSIKEMLRNLKIAFVDANGVLLADAEFDVDHTFPEGGKYTVPIVVTSSDCSFEDISGTITKGITSLEKNVATRISVVLYLEGENLDNSMAMTNGSIEGKLNLQFGSSVDLSALKNTDVSMQTISLRAEISDTSFTFDGTAKSPKLTAYIEGLTIGEGTEVQAVFQRRINDTQGSRTDPVVLENTSGTTWEGYCNFNLPGTYVLRSLWIAGVEYALSEEYWITVTVEGFAVESVTFCSAPGEGLALTADTSVTRNVAVKFASEIMPTRVAVKIVSTDGRYVTCSLTYDQNTRQWVGTARFTASGIYTITYLVTGIGEGANYMEADTELAASFQNTLSAYLGLQARVLINDSVTNTAFDFKGAQTYDVKVQILTNTGTTMDTLPYDITINYGKRGSDVAAKGLQATLKWSEGYYVGEFNVDKVGVFNFTRLIVGSNVITSTVSAPSITARSVEPPVYAGSSSGDTYFVSKNESLGFIAQIDNAEGVNSVQAVFKNNGTGRTFTVDGSAIDNQGVLNYVFDVPVDNGSRHGLWTVVELQIEGVYDLNGNYYGTDDENAFADYYSLEVNHTLRVYEGLNMDINATSVSDVEFLQEVDLSNYVDNPDGSKNGLWISITENNGFSLADAGVSIKSIELALKHNGDSDVYGGYTIENGTSNYQSIRYNFANPTTGNLYINSQFKTGLAGTYNGTIKVTLSNGVSFEYEERNVLTISSKTKVPNVKIVSAKYASTSSGSNATVTDTYVKVYHYKEETSNGCGGTTTTYHQPSVTLELSGYGNANSATITFSSSNAAGEVYMYDGSTQVNTAVWSGNGTIVRNVGTPSTSSPEPAGVLAGNKIVLKDKVGSNCDYVVNTSITIENPKSE